MFSKDRMLNVLHWKLLVTVQKWKSLARFLKSWRKWPKTQENYTNNPKLFQPWVASHFWHHWSNLILATHLVNLYSSLWGLILGQGASPDVPTSEPRFQLPRIPVIRTFVRPYFRPWCIRTCSGWSLHSPPSYKRRGSAGVQGRGS